MATLGSTNVTASFANAPLALGPFTFEIYRVTGGTVGDTATIAPSRGRYVVAAAGGPIASTTLSTAGTATNVVFTLTASAATTVTFDAWLLIAP